MGSEKEKEGLHSGQPQAAGEGKEPDSEDWVPLSVREARQVRKIQQNLWPSIWMTFASIILLGAALAILSYRMGAQSCH